MSRNPARVLAEKRKAESIDALLDTEIAEADFGPFLTTLSDGRKLHQFGVPPMNPYEQSFGTFVSDPRKTKDRDYRVFKPLATYKAERSTRPRAKAAPKKRTYQKKVYQIPSLSVKDYGQARLKRGSKFTRKNYGESVGKATKRQKSNRTKYGYTGRGSYMSDLYNRGKGAVNSKGFKSFVKGAKRGLGYTADALALAALLAPEADPVLLPLAAGAQTVSNYIGRGMYNPVTHGVNDLIAGGSSSTPRMMSVPDETGSIIVSHTERVADIIAPGDEKFHVQSFTVQAGLEETFPWLHQMAAAYEEYEVLQCVFQYKGHDIVGMQNTLDLQGQVIAATKYNMKSSSFTDRHQMQAYPHSASCSLNGTLQSGVEAHPSKIASGDTHRYIRTGGLKADEDVTDYDHARFELALNNTPTDLFNKEVGQLFVFYTIKLTKPRLFAARGSAISSYLQVHQTPDQTTGSRQYPFGTVSGSTQALVASRNSLSMQYLADPNAATWRFPASASGRYRIQFVVYGGALDSTLGDFGGLFVVAGEVTKLLIPGSNSVLNGASATRDAADMHIVVMEVLVRPQIGNVFNEVKVNNMLFAQASDTVFRSSVRFEEVNDLGEPSALPEFVGVLNKTLTAFVVQ